MPLYVELAAMIRADIAPTVPAVFTLGLGSRYPHPKNNGQAASALSAKSPLSVHKKTPATQRATGALKGLVVSNHKA